MQGAHPPSPGTPRLADRLLAARHKYFVGRGSELELLRSALAEPEPPFAVLFIYGPSGIGKTTLLGEYARIAREAGCFAVSLDARNLDPSPAGFLAALSSAMGLDSDQPPLPFLAQRGRSVLCLDTYELLAPLDAWLRDSFLPQLPRDSLVVIAGQNPPAPAWRASLDWRELVRAISLRNLHPGESKAYLSARRIPAAHHGAVLEFTHGHPLALSLVADVLEQGDQRAAFRPEDEPDVVRLLLSQFLQHVPSLQHRQALEVCAHARVTTEALLAEVLGQEAAQPLFDWLCGLSFVQRGPEGVFPHDLARDVLDADLRWRNPDEYARLHRQVRGYLGRRFEASRGLDQQRAVADLLFMHRHSPGMKPFLEWKAFGNAYVEPATPQDFGLILEMVQRHEGEAAAQVARHWMQRQPQAFLVFRGAGGAVTGFMADLALHQATPEDLQADPAAQAALSYIERHGRLRPGEEAIHHRFWMGRDTHQAVSPALNMVVVHCTTVWFTNPRLAWAFITVAEPDHWQMHFSYINFWRAAEAEFEVGGRRYGVYAHDWRAEPSGVWAEVLAERELATDWKPEPYAPTAPQALLVLSQTEFDEAVRQALRDYPHADRLASNPLLRSRLVVEAAGPAGPVAALQAVLREAAHSLTLAPRDEKFYRAVRHTYLEPAPTQERAAELLDLPFGTYRYQLNIGLKRIVEWLWQRELHGFQG